MSKRQNFEKHKHDKKKKLSVIDEQEYNETDRAAKWLKAVEDKTKRAK